MSGRLVLRLVALLGFTCLSVPKFVQACSVCVGDPDSPQTRGMSLAILFLLIVTAGVLGGMGTFFLYLMKRARSAAGDPLAPLGLEEQREVRNR